MPFLRLRIHSFGTTSSFELLCYQGSTIAGVIQKIRDVRNEPFAKIHLLRNKEALSTEATLQELGLKDRDILHMIMIRPRSASIA